MLLVALGLGFFELTLDRGLREDWFASGLIVTTAAISASSLIALVFWELNHKDPVIDLRLLKNRNFSLTLLIMGITGLILFGTTQLIPQMLQQVLGYSSFQAGLALTAGGVERRVEHDGACARARLEETVRRGRSGLRERLRDVADRGDDRGGAATGHDRHQQGGQKNRERVASGVSEAVYLHVLRRYAMSSGLRGSNDAFSTSSAHLGARRFST